jgi:hypothetical protein
VVWKDRFYYSLKLFRDLERITFFLGNMINKGNYTKSKILVLLPFRGKMPVLPVKCVSYPSKNYSTFFIVYEDFHQIKLSHEWKTPLLLIECNSGGLGKLCQSFSMVLHIIFIIVKILYFRALSDGIRKFRS